MGDMNEKLLAMGWDSVSVDGHDHAALWEAFARAARGRPMAIVANTVKGKGVSLFEDKVLWHYKWPEDEHYEQALKELEQA